MVGKTRQVNSKAQICPGVKLTPERVCRQLKTKLSRWVAANNWGLKGDSNLTLRQSKL